MKFIHEIVAIHALDPRKQDHIAIQLENNEQISYKQLHERTNQIANYLLSLDVKSGDRIVVMLPPSEMHPIMLLALSKIGATYVPIDPQQKCPEERIKAIITDCAPKKVITNQNIITSRNLSPDSKHIFIEQAAINEQASELPEKFSFALAPDPDAYIMYTSGTTGTPKGVRIGHLGLVNYWRDVLKSHLTGEHKVAGIVSPAFDASIWEYLMTWSTGGTFFLAEQKTRDDLNEVVRFLQQNAITDVTLIPAQIRAIPNFAETIIKLQQSGLQAIFSTGEACGLDILTVLEPAGIKLFNCYGPTEATIGLSIQEVSSKLIKDGIIPIGLPHSDDVKIHILNDELQAVADGEDGILFIESPYLSEGYLNRPKETQANFLTLPRTNAKVYNTNDRFTRSNGQLYYQGRANDSRALKINGILVNLNEIEAAIRDLGVQNVAVVTVTPAQGKRQLVAFLKCDAAQATDTKAISIQAKLQGKLIEVAIPHYFQLIDDLPFTVSGKIDYSQLTQTALSLIDHTNNTKPQNPPRTPLEEELSNLWKALLKISSAHGLDIKKTFKEYGGDSLSLNILINEINSKFGIQASITGFTAQSFSSSKNLGLQFNIENLAKYLHQSRWRKNLQQADAFLAHSSSSLKRPIFLIPPITGEAITSYRDLAKDLGEAVDTRIYAPNAPGLSHKYDIHSDMHEIAEYFADFIEAAQPEGDILLIGWSFGGAVSRRIANILENRGRKIGFIGMIDTVAPAIYQKMNENEFATVLCNIATHLFAIFLSHGIKSVLQTSPSQLASLSKPQQIETVFNELAAAAASKDLLLNLVLTAKINLLSTLDDFKQSKETIFNKTPRLYSTSTSEDAHGIGLGWKGHINITGTLEGDHFSIIADQDHRQGLIEKLAKKISKKLSTSATSSDSEEAKYGSPPNDDVLDKIAELLREHKAGAAKKPAKTTLPPFGSSI